MAPRITKAIILGISVLAAALFATLWIVALIGEDETASGEICYRAIDFDSDRGGTERLNHFGYYGGGFYWARYVSELSQTEKRYLKQNGERRWYRWEQLATAIQEFEFTAKYLQGFPAKNHFAPDWSGLGFKAYRFKAPKYEHGHVLVIPDWFLIAASMIAPTIALWNWRKRRAKRSQRGFPL